MKALTSQQWARVARLFDEALEQPPQARADWLDQACVDAEGRPDAALRAEVELLLQADDAAEADTSFRDAAIHFDHLLSTRIAPGSEDLTGARVGPYRIVGELGRGGMGTVYLAERADGQFEQRVALKLIRQGLDSPEARHRFLVERQILARLTHPNIAHLLDGGVGEDGQPWFAMEYVEGQPLTTYCDERKLSINERLDLFRTVGEAVAYAHRNLIVHRDLKPVNILVTTDGGPEDGPSVKLLDFGVAKLLEDEEPEDVPPQGLTRPGFQALTPEYAAPEQVRGEAITTATDVYALGLVLYELLTGHRPFRFVRTTLAEIERVVCEQEPVKPSTVVRHPERVTRSDGEAGTVTPDAISAARSTQTQRLRRRLGGDLDTIVLKALRKAPERRYASAEALVEDVRRHQVGLPVLARNETVWYRTTKFVRRHRTGVTLVVLLLAALVAGLVGTMWQAREARRQAALAEEVKGFLVDLFETSDPDRARGDSVTVRTLLDDAAVRVDSELTGDPLLRAELQGVLGEIYRKLDLYDEARTQFERALAFYQARRNGRYRARKHDRPAEATVLNALAGIDFEQGNYEKAEQLYREALALRQRYATPAVAGETASNLGNLLRYRNRLPEADSFLTLAVTLQRDNPDVDLFTMGTTLDRLASLRRVQGRLAEAEPLAREALALRIEDLGPEHRHVYLSKNNLALLLFMRGRLDEADSLYHEVLAFNRQRYGEQHTETATALSHLADVAMERGRYAEAEDLYRQVTAIDVQVLGAAHPWVALGEGHISQALLAQGRVSEAERYAQEALDGSQGALGEAHPDAAVALRWLADVRAAQGDTAQAMVMYRQSLDRLREALPSPHPKIADGLMALGRCLSNRDSAAVLFREALDMREATLGPDHAHTKETLAELAALSPSAP